MKNKLSNITKTPLATFQASIADDLGLIVIKSEFIYTDTKTCQNLSTITSYVINKEQALNLIEDLSESLRIILALES